MLSRRAMCATPLAMLAAGGASAARGSMMLCMHTNTSAAAGYRGALQGWAKAGIAQVELNAALVETFLQHDSRDAARRVLTDNGLTAVHGAVGVAGLLELDADHDDAIERLKRRLELFAFLGIRKAYTTSNGGRKLSLEEYALVAGKMRRVGETARAFGMMMSVEFVRASPYMSTLLTALKVTREAAHPNFGVMFDCYHFWSGPNRLEDLDQIRPGEIQHVHFQDVPDLPREVLDGESRAIPGDGVAPLDATLRKLAATGYAGPLSVELFLPTFTQRDPEALAREIRVKCERVMHAAGVA